MENEHHCIYHPSDKAASFCHHCHDWLCTQCITEGRVFYYCRKLDCQSALQNENSDLGGACPDCGHNNDPEATHCSSCGYKFRDPSTGEENEDLVSIGQYPSDLEAQMARSKLEGEGVVSFVIGDFAPNRDPLGVELHVKKSDVDRAIRILDLKP
jgi:hypothetical protein